jgi:hypothetical protein
MADQQLALRRRSPLQQPFAWPKALLALLGKVPDDTVARLAGVTRDTVYYERHRRRIPATEIHVRCDWTPEAVALLGTASDATVAAALGTSGSSVQRQRRLLGIPSFAPPPYPRLPQIQWGPEEIALLGTMSDEKLARKLGVSRDTVCRQRHLRNIPPFRSRRPDAQWTPAMLELLGKLPDPELAQRFGITVKAIKGKRRQLAIPCPVTWGAIVPTATLRRLLGAPATEVRRRTGLGLHTIAELRRKLGIQARRLTRPWQDAEIALLGTAPDQEIAQRLGRTVSAVYGKRRHLQVRRAPPPPAARARMKAPAGSKQHERRRP